MFPWQHSCFVPKWWLSWETRPKKQGASLSWWWRRVIGRSEVSRGADALRVCWRRHQTKPMVTTSSSKFSNKATCLDRPSAWEKNPPQKSETHGAARQEGSAEICAEPKCCQRMTGMWWLREKNQVINQSNYHYNPGSAAFSECQILRPVLLCFLWPRTCKRSVYWLLLPKIFPRFYPNIPFWKLLFWDFTKKERAREAWGILLPSQDALLDGFFDHLQGEKMKKWTTRPVLRFMHP